MLSRWRQVGLPLCGGSAYLFHVSGLEKEVSEMRAHYLFIKRAKLIIAVVAVMALALPCVAIAGDLEPKAPPGPTMHTLQELYNKPVSGITGTVFTDWPANPRFAVCDSGTTDNLSDDMVLDKETGLIWARDAGLPPYLSYSNPTHDGSGAWDFCRNITLGNRLGWQVPTYDELRSLIDPSKIDRVNPPASAPPSLPDGHPFINVKVSALVPGSDPRPTTSYYAAYMEGRIPMNYYWISAPEGDVYAWPVRGMFRH